MKTTDELLKLLGSSRRIGEYLSENADDLTEPDLTSALNSMLVKKGLTKGQVVRRADLSENYVYKIFAGDRRPERDKLLRLCFGLGADLGETRGLLRLGDCGELYPRRRRDSAIIFAIKEGLGLMECNELLYDLGEKILE